MHATAVAHPNIALVKYWGKRDAALNLPAVGSLSLTLAGISTRTRVELVSTGDHDVVELNGEPASDAERARVSRFVDLVRAASGRHERVRVTTENDFPTAAGLASSASGFAALSLAATHAFGLSISPRELSALARRGSGSAARSIFGGFVEMHRGERDDGSDAVAEPLLDAGAWPLVVWVAVTSQARKSTSSTDGMQHTRETSPYWQAWIEGQEHDLAQVRAAVLARDFEVVARVAEQSCLKMHALAMAASPGLIYFSPTTLALITRVRELRQAGAACFFSVDAGPQVKVFCEPSSAQRVKAALLEQPGVEAVIETRPGPGAQLVSDAGGPS